MMNDRRLLSFSYVWKNNHHILFLFSLFTDNITCHIIIFACNTRHISRFSAQIFIFINLALVLFSDSSSRDFFQMLFFYSVEDPRSTLEKYSVHELTPISCLNFWNKSADSVHQPSSEQLTTSDEHHPHSYSPRKKGVVNMSGVGSLATCWVSLLCYGSGMSWHVLIFGYEWTRFGLIKETLLDFSFFV